jgi:hypothetical protein
MTKINFLYTEIGRGHPHYLDGIRESLPSERIGAVTDVFRVSSELSRLAWRGAETAYRLGSGGGLAGALYNRLRVTNDPKRSGPVRFLLGRSLRRAYLRDETPLMVGHPVLASLLEGKRGLFYQHGEVAAPRESWVGVSGEIERVFVPLPETADRFIAAGLQKERLFVSGLCIERGLVERAEAAYAARQERVAGGEPLCGAYFSSGAEPRFHVETIATAAFSTAREGDRVILFGRRAGRLAQAVKQKFDEAHQGLDINVDPLDLPARMHDAALCLYDDRRELNEFTARLFNRFDYFVAPSHERTAWALGLGLPGFIVEPPIGSFAPLNRQFLLDRQVARSLSDLEVAARFGSELRRTRESGGLAAMAQAGWGRYEVRGFENIAGALGEAVTG